MARSWVSQQASPLAQGEFEVTILQWNILSQTLGVQGDFQACPAKALTWQHRNPLIVKVDRETIN